MPAPTEMATPATLRATAKGWDDSAAYCDEHDWPVLAIRDRGIAAALRRAADILEAYNAAP